MPESGLLCRRADQQLPVDCHGLIDGACLARSRWSVTVVLRRGQPDCAAQEWPADAANRKSWTKVSKLTGSRQRWRGFIVRSPC